MDRPTPCPHPILDEHSALLCGRRVREYRCRACGILLIPREDIAIALQGIDRTALERASTIPVPPPKVERRRLAALLLLGFVACGVPLVACASGERVAEGARVRSYREEIVACAESARSREESRACRAEVERRYAWDASPASSSSPEEGGTTR